MIFREKILKKSLALILTMLLVFNPTAAVLVFAEEEPTPTPTPTIEMTPTENPTPTPTSEVSSSESSPTPTSPETENTDPLSTVTPEPTATPVSSIDTGDAEASADVDVTVNTNDDTVAGDLTTPEGSCMPPEGETTCPDDVDVINDNVAEVDDTLTSSATTGDNQSTGSGGDATITTGDATASGTINNEVNTNTVTLEPSPTVASELTVTPTPSVVPEVFLTPTPTEEKTLTVDNSNEGIVTNEADVDASTGGNTADNNAGKAQIITGDALAWLNILNFLNANIVGANFEVLLLDLLSGDQSAILDLNQLWQSILDKSESDSLVLADGSSLSNLRLVIRNSNLIDLENNANVSASTGENQANGNDEVLIDTGDATALANVINIVNTNILGSEFLLAVINILGFQGGDLILPRPEKFSQSGSTGSGDQPVVFENDNAAEVEDQTTALAETGGNQVDNNGGDNTMTTGEATAFANDLILSNLNFWRNNWFFLIITNLGQWTGKILNWSAPGAVDTPLEGTQILEIGLRGPGGSTGENVSLEGNLPLVTFQNQNKANVTNDVSVSASTGENQANENLGGSRIYTGNARAIANIFNLINLNILGGRWLMGFINIFNWSGNIIFAYPDLLVTLANGRGEVMVGETTDYTLSYRNLGYDEANGVNLELNLPLGISLFEDSSGLPRSTSGNTYRWEIGHLSPGKGSSFQIRVQISPDFSFEDSVSFWNRIVSQVRAAEREKEKQIIASASIGTSDPDSNLNNNSASVSTIVYTESNSSDSNNNSGNTNSGPDPRLPKLEITAKNNVNDFVYPGDTVTFEIMIKNTSDVPSYNTRLVQGLYNGVPGDLGQAEIEIGTIEPGRGGTLSFGLTLSDGEPIEADHYYTISKAIGHAPNGNEVSSNEARTDFNVRLRMISKLLEAKATTKEEEVLGNEAACPENDDILPYVLLFLLSSLYLVTQAKPRLQKILNK